MAEEKSQKWIDKVLEVFIKEIGQPPQEPDEISLMRKIMLVIQFRANGLDHRRMGLVAVDMYRLMHSVRRRVIEDMAKVAANQST